MRNLSRLIALILVVSAPAQAEPTKIAVFDFELVDTSLQGEVDGPRADEQRRLREAGDQLRKALADSGKFIVLDIANQYGTGAAIPFTAADLSACQALMIADEIKQYHSIWQVRTDLFIV